MADAKGDGAGTLWRSTVDPKSGRTYYYHKVTKETRWDKPDDMCDPEERAEKIKRREETAAFFRAMEKNITTKIDSGWKVEIERNTQSHLRLSMPGGGGFATLSTDDGEMHQFNPEVDFKAMSPRNLSPTSNPLSFRVRRSTSVSTASRFVRTFSSMDDDMLELFRNSSRDQASSPRAGGITRTSSRDGTGVGAGYKDDGETGRLSSPSFPGYYIGGGAEAKNDANSPRERQRSASIDSKDTTSSRDRESIHRMSYSNRTHSPDLEGRSNNIGEQLPFGRKRRNSTGTLYVSTTMSQQDDEVAIKCVCRVIRAHMLDAARENIAPLKEYDMFKDRDYRARSSSLARNFGEDGTRNSSPTSFSAALPSPGKSVSFSPMADDKYYMSSPIGSPTSMGSGSTPNAADEERKVPSLEVVVGFFRQIYKKSQLESECIIMALIYCERLIKETRGRLCIRYDNWRPILFACLVMSSKVWDDMSMWNADFSQILPSYNLKRINELELAMLDALKFTIRVSASEYAKYYFLLRSMIAKLGLHKEDPNYCKPLDIIGAKRLQLATEKYDSTTVKNITRVRRSVTVANLQRSLEQRSQSRDDMDQISFRNQIGLEQLMHSEHNDADGRSRILRKKEKDSGFLDGELDAIHSGGGGAHAINEHAHK